MLMPPSQFDITHSDVEGMRYYTPLESCSARIDLTKKFNDRVNEIGMDVTLIVVYTNPY